MDLLQPNDGNERTELRLVQTLLTGGRVSPNQTKRRMFPEGESELHKEAVW